MAEKTDFYHYVLSVNAKATEWYIEYARDKQVRFVCRSGGKFCLTPHEKSAERFATQQDARNALHSALEEGEIKACA